MMKILTRAVYVIMIAASYLTFYSVQKGPILQIKGFKYAILCLTLIFIFE